MQTTSWMARLFLALILTLVPILATLPASAAAAADSPDQTSGAGDPGSTYRANGLAQSFTAGKSGYLNQIDLYMAEYGSSGIVFTLNIYAGQSVTGTVLATATFGSSDIPYNPGGWLSVLFDQPAQVQNGQQYTMHLTSSIGDTPQTSWKLYTADVYLGGRAYTDSNWSNHDMGFTTYVGDSPRDFTTTLAVSPVTGTYGQTVTISATLTTPEGPLVGKRLTVSINGSPIGILTTNSAGIGSGTYSLRQAAGSYDLKVAIAASYPYTAAEQTTTLTVNKAPLTVTPNNATRPYGKSNGTFTMGFSGLLAWDTASSLGQPVYSTPADASSPIGNYGLTASGLTSTKYTITYAPGTLTVTPAPLTVTAADQTRAYGQSNPSLSGSITGLVNGDAILASYSTAAAVSSPVGSYPIVPALSDPGGKLSNYHVVIEQGELTVTKAALRVATDSVSRWVGKANPQLTGNLTGVVAGDSITAEYESAATVVSAEGVYDITAQLLDPLNRLPNYELITDTGKLTVYAAPKPVFAAGETAGAVKSNVGLPGTDAAGRPIRWTSSDNNLLDATTGAVHRPAYSAGDSAVTLEAAVDANQTTYDVQYNLSIIAADMTDKEAVTRDMALLTIGYAAGDDETHVRNGLTLPAAGTNGSAITWASSRTELINPADGSVSRPSYGAGDQTVTLTATVTKGLDSDSRQYTVTVTRAAAALSSDADLSGLALSSGTLSPAFANGTTDYTASAANEIDSIKVAPTVSDANATVTASVYNSSDMLVSGPFTLTSGTESQSLPLSVGSNAIKVTVTAQDGTTTKTYTVTVTRAAAATPSDTGPSNGNPEGSPNTQLGFDVVINGRKHAEIATGAITKENGQNGQNVQNVQNVLTVTVDTSKLSSQLSSEGNKPTIVIPIMSISDKVTVVLTGDAVKAMEKKQAILEVQTPTGNYRIPAAAVLIDQISKQFEQVKLSDIAVRIDIAKSDSAKVRLMEETAQKGKLTVVVQPVDFKVNATVNGHTVNVDKFNSYVEREIPLPAGVDPSRVTTAVVLEADGTIRHVPTYVTSRNSKYLAVINSLTNSTYSLIWHPMTFADVEGHWAKDVVNDMASRMIVNGIDAKHFNPDAAITRAEFAAIIIRALGLAEGKKTPAFADVSPDDWYAGAIVKAREYRIIEGYVDGTFRPAQTITREEAMVMIERAMKLTRLDTSVSSTDEAYLITSFKDSASVSPWAKTSVEAIVKNGLVVGSDAGLLPSSNITRAETAAILQRMLFKAKLIDEGNSK